MLHTSYKSNLTSHTVTIRTICDELAQKGLAMAMLKLELYFGPSARNRSAAALKIRRDKQQKMEVIMDRLSELEELERVEAVKKHSLPA
jgi:hypothetical protein